jgi:hypothetical protein
MLRPVDGSLDHETLGAASKEVVKLASASADAPAHDMGTTRDRRSATRCDAPARRGQRRGTT